MQTFGDADWRRARQQREAGEPFAFLQRHSATLLAALLTLFFMLVALKSRTKTVWFDEVFTAFLAMQPDWKHFLGSMPAEGNPPLSGILTGISMRLLGVTPFALRLPQMLGMTGALAGMYLFVKRECGVLYGFLALALTLSQHIWTYAIEARPYGLLMCFLMIAVLGWQASARSDSDRLMWLLMMAVGIAGCILSHNIGIVTVGLVLFTGETVRVMHRRRLDWPMIAAAALGLLPLLVTIPMIRHTKQVVLVHQKFLEPPYTVKKLIHYGGRVRDTAYQVFSLRTLLALLVVVGFCAVWSMRSRRIVAVPSRRIARHIWAAAIAMALLIPVAWVAMIPSGGLFFCRYGMASALGCVIVVCFVCATTGTQPRYLALTIAAALSLFLYLDLRSAPEFPLDKQFMGYLEAQTDTTPIVIADAFKYPPMWWNAAPNLRPRILYLAGAGYKNSVNDAAIESERPFWPTDIRDFESFVDTHDRFFALCYHPVNECLEPYLQKGVQPEVLDPVRHYYAMRNPYAVSHRVNSLGGLSIPPKPVQ